MMQNEKLRYNEVRVEPKPVAVKIKTKKLNTSVEQKIKKQEPP